MDLPENDTRQDCQLLLGRSRMRHPVRNGGIPGNFAPQKLHNRRWMRLGISHQEGATKSDPVEQAAVDQRRSL